MTAIALEQDVPTTVPKTTHRPIPMTRLTSIELRKMFDTRSGFWMMASIVITAVVATGAVIIFAPDSAITYDSFAAAIGVPMTIILPMVAILSVTGEWSQRSGLTTFTLVPHRSRVILAKAIAAVVRRRRLDRSRAGGRSRRQPDRIGHHRQRSGLGHLASPAS